MNKLKKLILPLVLPLYITGYKLYTLYIDPYKYKEERYSDSFVSINKKVGNVKLEKAKEIIFIFWTGNNEIPPNRLLGIDSLKKLSEVKVVLITASNVDEYVLKDFPLHPAHEYLSFVHRADYLRSYFMLHYGGGYSDIKPCLMSWKKLFEELNSSDDKWCIAPREKYVGGVPDIDGTIGRDIKKYHNYLISNGAFVYKPYSPIVAEWIEEAHKRLDLFLPELKKCNANEYDRYPISWSHIMAQIMHPLVLKYHERVICKDINLFSTKNYR